MWEFVEEGAIDIGVGDRIGFDEVPRAGNRDGGIGSTDLQDKPDFHWHGGTDVHIVIRRLEALDRSDHMVVVQGEIGEAEIALSIALGGAVVAGDRVGDFDFHVLHGCAGDVRYGTLDDATCRRLGIASEGQCQAQQ